MPEDVYRKLAQRLDAIPNGFPATESGVELRLLAKIFTPQQAGLAAEMRLTLEPAAAIAGRAGLDPDETYDRLKGMLRQGLVRVQKRDGQLHFGLLPFAVGIYEEQLPRIDEDMAALFEAYYQETRGGMLTDQPSIHRVIPVMEPIAFELEIFPYEQATELLEGARSWGVRDCICRVQQRLVGQPCDHPVENCLVFAPVENAFRHSEVTRPISQEEALAILRQAEEDGLVHSTGNYRDNHFYICNCCTCSCGILRGLAEFDLPTAVARSAFRITVDEALCNACGDCLARCQFDALTLPDFVAQVNLIRCVGCGLCSQACPTEALILERRPLEEVERPPETLQAWMLERANRRSLDIFQVL